MGSKRGESGDLSILGVIDEVGGFRPHQNGVVDTTEDVFFEVSFVAAAPGEVLFAANPAENIPSHDILLLGSDFPALPQWVDYGFVRLQIGNPASNPPSPWRNPKNPFDVNNNGVVTIRDATLTIEAGSRWQYPADPLDTNNDGTVAPGDALVGINLLNSRGAITLGDHDMMLSGSPVYLDTNGDRHHSAVDVLGVVNRLNSAYKFHAEGEQVATSARVAVSPPQQAAIAADKMQAENDQRSTEVELASASPIPYGGPGTEERPNRSEHSVERLVDEELLDTLARGMQEDSLGTLCSVKPCFRGVARSEP